MEDLYEIILEHEEGQAKKVRMEVRFIFILFLFMRELID
jgi:hypothetical protein